MAKAKKKAGDCGCMGAAAEPLAEPLVAIVARERATAERALGVRSVRIEKARAGKEDSYEFETVGESDVSEGFTQACERGKVCLPWVRVTRDPTHFRACFANAQKKGRIESSEDLYNIVSESMIREDQEVFYVVMVDTQMYVRGIGELARGSRQSVSIPVPDVLRLPLVDGATAYFVCHNHPSGHPQPSEADKELTETLKKASKAVGIEMLDHLVIGVNSYYSFADNKVHRVGKRK